MISQLPDEHDASGDASQPVPSRAAVEERPPGLERIPLEQREAIVQVIESQLSHSGPLPPPVQLREYEAVMPGLAERIVRLTEGEQKHRHDIMKYAIERDATLRSRGQIFGMAALILTLAFCVLLLVMGNPAIAGTVAIGLVAAVVGIFVIGRRADIREREIADDE